MAAKKFEKGSAEWNMFMDFWALCQKHWIPERNEEFWEIFIEDTMIFYEKHHTPFARSLYMSLYTEVERKIDEEKRVQKMDKGRN